MYQIVREAIANAIKHARPSTIAVLARALDGGATELGARRRHRHARLGLRDGLSQGTAGMRERAATMGGTSSGARPTSAAPRSCCASPCPPVAQAA